MMEPGSCPDISALSSFLDGELEGDENIAVKVHLENCPACAKRLKALENAGQLMSNQLEKPVGSAAHSRSADCIGGEMLSSYLHDLLTSEEKRTVESHLSSCDSCLSELSAMARTDTQLHQTAQEPLPAYLRERVENLWKKSEKATDQVLRLVCRVAKDGIEFLRDSLLPEGLSVQQGFATAGSYRSGPESSPPKSILVKGTISDIQLGISVEWERLNRAGLKLKLDDEASKPLQAQRVLLRREQVLIHSERTDASGKVAIASLEPGTYQLGIVISGKELRVDLDIKKA